MDKIRVAVYCRVSGRDEKRHDSITNQRKHYEALFEQHDDWRMAGVFSDLGTSGYKDSRKGFNSLLDACHMGKVDLILTKSISRFARNTYTLITTVRKLSDLNINIYFELQNIYTLSAEGDLLMTLYAAFAQAESEGARRQTQMSVKKRYEAGNPTRHLDMCLGYTKTESGDFVPDEDAAMVSMMFDMATSGVSVYQITKYLNEKHYHTKQGKKFCQTGVTRILRNPSYTGDFVYQRFYVDEERHIRPNRGEKPMYKIIDDHPAIVSRKIWNTVQLKLDEAAQRYRMRLKGGKDGQEGDDHTCTNQKK